MSTKTIPFHCGMNLGFKAPRGYFSSAEGMAQLERMAALNIDRVALIVSVYMDHCANYFTDPAGPQTFTVDGKPSSEVMSRLYAGAKAAS